MFRLLGLLAVTSLGVQAVQRGFDPNPTEQTPLGFNIVPTQDNFTTLSLSSLALDDFTTLKHPNFPRHSVRIKRTKKDWCDPGVASYTGYIDTTGARHIFFYFFESRNNPDTDNVILWTNGGPGCSSSLGLFMELGPCRVVDNTTTKYHPQSWNEKANVFFIDQPIGRCDSELLGIQLNIPT
jgi:cathepsin A (carboxypeptidase C)